MKGYTMRIITITAIFITIIIATISAQSRFDLSPILPGDHSTNSTRIYENLPSHIPENKPAFSTDTDEIIWVGLRKIADDESSVWEKKVIVTKIAKKTELIFTSRRAERLYNETIFSPDISEKKINNFKLLVVLVAKRGQKISKETVKELSQHI